MLQIRNFKNKQGVRARVQLLEDLNLMCKHSKSQIKPSPQTVVAASTDAVHDKVGIPLFAQKDAKEKPVVIKNKKSTERALHKSPSM